MTICIAALAEDGARAVLVSDQLSTLQFSVGVESPDIPKIHLVGKDAAILTAGKLRESHEIVRFARQAWLANSSGEFSEVVRKTYSDFRNMKAEQAYLEPLGMTLERFERNQKELQPEFVGRLSERLAAFDLHVHLITVSHSDGACRITGMVKPSELHDATSSGYVAIGDGAEVAIYAMFDMGYKKSMSLADVTAIALAAKKKSEKVPSVGAATTVIEFPRVDP